MIRAIISNTSFTRICIADENENIIDITDKCSEEMLLLCRNISKVVDDYNIFEMLEMSKIEEVEPVYEYIVEKIYRKPFYANDYILFEKEHIKIKVLIAFNKFFLNLINNENA